MAPRDDQQSPEWKRLHYPDQATFDRILREQPDSVYDEASNDYLPFHGLPAWIRLGWPSKALWDRAARTVEREEAMITNSNPNGARARVPVPFPVARMSWADVLKKYPKRDAPEEKQDYWMLLHYWPDCFGQTMVDVDLHLVRDIITINDKHYGRGRHRLPQTVANVVMEIAQKSRDEFIKASIPKEHAERIIATIGPTGAVL